MSAPPQAQPQWAPPSVADSQSAKPVLGSPQPVSADAVRYQGRDGSLVVDGADVVIEHNDRSIPDFRVAQSSITAVHFEPATRFVSGIVTIATDGAPLVVPTGTDCGSDLRTVVFKHSANDAFYGVQAWLRQVISDNLERSGT